jgi:hypothetical protein
VECPDRLCRLSSDRRNRHFKASPRCSRWTTHGGRNYRELCHFDKQAIADALILYFKHRVLEYERPPGGDRIRGRLEGNFIRLANSRFLDFLVEYCCDRNSPVADLLVAYAATELYERWLKLSFQTYEKAVAVYKSERFTFDVPDAKQAQLQFLNPVQQNRMKDYCPSAPGK